VPFVIPVLNLHAIILFSVFDLAFAFTGAFPEIPLCVCKLLVKLCDLHAVIRQAKISRQAEEIRWLKNRDRELQRQVSYRQLC
jgi:hypothetical protein